MKKYFVYVMTIIIILSTLIGCESESTNSDSSDEKFNNSTASTAESKTFEYNDGFMVVTYEDIGYLQKRDDFTDICITGTIIKIDNINNIRIKDSVEGEWTVDVGTDRDLSAYIGTQCEVYGFSSGGISSQHNTPLINMNHDENRIKFNDGKELYPEKFESTQQFDRKDFGDHGGNSTVWLPTDGGKKYHSKSNCSSMNNPVQATESEAINRGFSKCGKCW